MNQTPNKKELRRSLRQQRSNLTSQELAIAEKNLAKNARSSNRLLKAKRVLSYSPFAGEISPKTLVSKLSCQTVYYPKITNFGLSQMRFYSAKQISTQNKYGIEEPIANGSPWPANAFDIILIPLVAFDRSGTRIGMGAGYYDRAMHALAHQPSTRPYLVGVAHHFQEITSLARESWDVPLDAILTDHEYIVI